MKKNAIRIFKFTLLKGTCLIFINKPKQQRYKDLLEILRNLKDLFNKL